MRRVRRIRADVVADLSADDLANAKIVIA